MGRSRSRDRYDRKRSRSRSRDRDRSRERRRRSRSRDRKDKGWSDPDPAVAQIQALGLAQAQAQLQRQMLAQQQALLAAMPAVAPPAAALVAAAAAGGATLATAPLVDSTTARKSRELYVGNLAIGQVTPEMIEELFNAALAGMVSDPLLEPPVVNVKPDASSGRFAFVEFRTEELATTAMALDKTELLGRSINVGRPKGYVPGSAAQTANETQEAAQLIAAALVGGATNVLLLENMLKAADMRDADERQEVSRMVYEETVRCGKVLGIAVPIPPPDVADDESSRVYVKFATSGEASKCKEMMDGRLFDDNKVKATHVTESQYSRAAAGEWIRPGQPPPAPAAAVQPFSSSLPGLSSIPGLGGLAGLPGPGTGLIPGLPGNAPLAIPSLTTGSLAPTPLGGFGAFPPPP